MLLRRLLVSTAAALAVAAVTPAIAAPPPLPPVTAPPVPPAPSLQAPRQVDPQALAGGPLHTADGRRAAALLADTSRYAMTTWWPRVAPGLLERVSRRPAAFDTSDSVRRLGMEAMSLSVALRTGVYDARRSGASAAQAKAAVAHIVRVLAATHVANRPGGWGGGGQTSLWSSFAGRAAWLMGSDLPASTQALAQKMLVFEADAALQTGPLYLRDRVGTVVRPGNSAAEEDSWQALPLQLATATLPGHPHWTAWRHAEVVLMLSSWARPQDVTDATVVNGAPVAAWVNGSNVEANGSVVNHGRIAPDYSTSLYQNIDGVLVDALAGLPSPDAARWGLSQVYRGLSEVPFTGRGYAAPGGTVYQGGRVYYPQGCDWGLGQALPYALVDAQAAALGFGTGRSAGFESAHLHEQQRLMARFGTGRTYGAFGEYRYVGREEHTAQLAAQLFLTKLVRDRGLVRFTDEPLFAPAARDALGLAVKAPVGFTELGVQRG